MYQPWEQAVIDYQNKKLLLDLKHGGEQFADISPGGWFETWCNIVGKLQNELSNYINDHDVDRVLHALKAQFGCGCDGDYESCLAHYKEKDKDVN